LQRATTLGFRGEAIPSIASVSRMIISTGVEGEGARSVVEIDGGTVLPLRHESGPAGTTITVADLFFNTPARLRFLKSDATELRNAIEITQKLALAHPEIAFAFKSGVQMLFQSPGDGDSLAALAAVWGIDSARGVVLVDRYAAGVRIRGFISPPEFTRATRAYQWLFVNGRPIRSRSLGMAIEVAYRQLTPERRFPLAALSISIDPASVDANVSPTKTEVKFQHEGTVFDAVRHAIKDTLLERGMIPSADGIAAANAALRGVGEPVRQFGLPLGAAPIFDTAAGGSANTMVTFGIESGSGDMGMGLSELVSQAVTYASTASTVDHAEPVQSNTDSADVGSLLDGLRLMGQTSDCTFIIGENRQGLVIIDQHVAHERILFEMLCRERGHAAIESQALLVPQTAHLDPREAAVLLDRLDDVREIGFDLEPFGPGSFVVRAIPSALGTKNPVLVLKEIVEEMMETSQRDRIVPPREILWITCSCKMAIKAGDPLTMVEMQKLMQDLALCENPYLCPHGRPITIVLSWTDLLRKFKRS
ncbi:MAG: DNA mismatch repair endonuclease MutL, partial [Armatimonadetes bacterium]|nr:DNA mismatch repair endonuclease MutL [Armatimonadota bacterium]